MEWAIHVADGSSLEHCDDFFSRPPRSSELPLSDLQAAAADVVQRVAGPVRPQRAYLGNEFCQYLIPARESFSKVCRELRERGLAITFLTPPVTDAGLDKLRPLFAWLAAQANGAEVVFNDWGTLQVLHEEFDALRPVRGRLLNKTMRDPRVTPLHAAGRTRDAIAAAPATPLWCRDGRTGHLASRLDLGSAPAPVSGGVLLPLWFRDYGTAMHDRRAPSRGECAISAHAAVSARVSALPYGAPRFISAETLFSTAPIPRCSRASCWEQRPEG